MKEMWMFFAFLSLPFVRILGEGESSIIPLLFIYSCAVIFLALCWFCLWLLRIWVKKAIKCPTDKQLRVQYPILELIMCPYLKISLYLAVFVINAFILLMFFSPAPL